MRIGIDAREIEGEMTGIGRYLKGFINYICDSPHEYFLYCSCKLKPDLNYSNIQVRMLSGPQFVWDHIVLPRALVKDKINLFFSPYYKKPWSLKCSSIITVHDLNILFDSNYSLLRRMYFKKIVGRSLCSADVVFAVSNYVKKELLKTFNIDTSKIIVNHNSIDERFRPIEENNFSKTILTKYGIGSEYILYIGNLLPHKNVGSAIRAYSALPVDIKDKYKLVIGGSKKWAYRKLVELTDRLGLANNVIFTGFVDEDDLVYLYNRASLFIFLSFREGFGFPPLEAMACGIAVIASNRTSLPEIMGDAGILIDPDNIRGISEAMIAILTKEDLRRGLIEKGLARAKEFCVEKTAKRILEAFARF